MVGGYGVEKDPQFVRVGIDPFVILLGIDLQFSQPLGQPGIEKLPFLTGKVDSRLSVNQRTVIF